MNVYTLEESARHESRKILGIYQTEEKAMDALEEEAEDCRFDEIRRWSTDDDDHIKSIQLLDITMIVRRWKVQ